MTEKPTNSIEEFVTEVSHLMASIELVFDEDWEHTLNSLHPENIDHYIEGTFLQPCVGDESNNWHNRGSLLSTYRRLVSIMDEMNIPRKIEDIHDR